LHQIVQVVLVVLVVASFFSTVAYNWVSPDLQLRWGGTALTFAGFAFLVYVAYCIYVDLEKWRAREEHDEE